MSNKEEGIIQIFWIVLLAVSLIFVGHKVGGSFGKMFSNIGFLAIAIVLFGIAIGVLILILRELDIM